MANPSNNPPSNNLRAGIYLAGLLHDIGKFCQRADPNGEPYSEVISPDARKAMADICPEHQGKFSHKHVVWSWQFLLNHEAKFKALHQKLGLRDEQISLLRLACTHHNPASHSIPELLLQQADHYASGADRRGKPGKQDGRQESEAEIQPQYWETFKCQYLHPIFEGLMDIQFQQQGAYRKSVGVASLSLSTDYLQRKHQIQSPKSVHERYGSIWEPFEAEFARLSPEDPTVFIETLTFLLHKYAVTVPSSTINLRDVSLYDHLRITAAFAICLYDYLQACFPDRPITAWSLDLQDSDAPVLLVGGDLSGIQKFIYDIIGDKAAKNLKGRSFYLQLWIDGVVERILEALQLFSGNIVYASGGKFYLLVPNTERTREILLNLHKQIQDELFQQHRGQLFLALDWVGVRHDQLLNRQGEDGEHLGTLWKKMGERLSRQKTRRFVTQIHEQFDQFFEPYGQGGNQEVDAITGAEILEQPRIISDHSNDSENANSYSVSPLVERQIWLGRKLRAAHTHHLNVDSAKEHTMELVQGLQVGFSSSQPAHIPRLNPRSRNLKINDLDFVPETFDPTAGVQGFAFYGGNEFPQEADGSPVLFDALAGPESSGFRRLGVLRMDVDNLGQCFIRGFEDKRRSFSRMAALSRELDWFFKGYLNTLRRSQEVFEQYSMIIYSGGDDLFILGRWDVMIEMAERIVEDFRIWVAGNEALTLSGGLAIVPPKFPIARAAALAGEAEKLAKDHSLEVDQTTYQKNSFALLDVPLHWQYEYPLVKKLKAQLVDRIEGNKLNRGFLQRIDRHYEDYRLEVEKQGPPRWRYMIAYDFGRVQEHYERKSETWQWLENLKQGVFADCWEGKPLTSNYPFLKLLHLAARWAELELRSKNT